MPMICTIQGHKSGSQVRVEFSAAAGEIKGGQRHGQRRQAVAVGSRAGMGDGGGGKMTGLE